MIGANELVSGITFACVMAVLSCLIYRGCVKRPVQMSGVDSSDMTGRDWAIVLFFSFAYGIGALTAAWNSAESKLAVPSVSSCLSGLLSIVCITLPVLWRLLRLPLSAMAGWSRLHWPSLILPVLGVPIIVYGIAILQELSGLSAWLTSMTGARELQDNVRYLQEGSLALQLSIGLSAVIVAPLAEELCFRGFFYPILKKYAGMWASLVIVSLFFSIIHQSLLQFIPLAVLSVLLIISYEKSRSIWVPICAHAFFNALTVGHILLQQYVL